MKKSPAKRASETLAGVVVQGARITGRTLRQPAQPEPIARRRYWVWAVLIALGWHAAWATWLAQAHIPKRSLNPPRLAITYLPELNRDVDSTLQHGELLRVWSPSLFALPTATGFSGGLPVEQRGIKPPLDALKERALFVDRQGASNSRGGETRLAEKVALEVARLTAPPPPGVTEPVFETVKTRKKVDACEVFFMGELEDSGIRVLDVSQDGLDGVRGAWTAEAQLHVSEDGVVNHAFLIRRTPDEEFDRRLLSKLRAMRFQPMGTARMGLARIHPQPAVTNPEPGQ